MAVRPVESFLGLESARRMGTAPAPELFCRLPYTERPMPPTFIPDELYARILDSVPIACVDIAIVARGGVLLVRRKDAPARGEWWVPGGRVLKGEMMRETAARKARE